MASVLKTLLDNLSSKISVNTSDITEINNRLNDVDSGVTLEEYINTNNSNISKLQSDLQSAGTDISSIESDVAEISSGLTSVRSEVTTARGGSASLDARLDAMTTATENAQSDAESAQNTANEAASSANTANSDIAAAADTFDSLKARLDDMTTDITELGTELNKTSSGLTSVRSQVNTARGSFASLGERIAANGFTGFGRVLNTTSKQLWVSLTADVHYYAANGVETTSDLAVYTIQKLYGIPVLVTVSIANILTVTSSDLLPTSISSINIEGVLYSVYAIQLPYITLINKTVVQNSYVDSPVVFAPDSNSITMSLIGNLGNMGSTVSSTNYNAYLPVLRPATSPGTVFKFLSTKIDPDTNTVQYSTFNSQITIPL